MNRLAPACNFPRLKYIGALCGRSFLDRLQQVGFAALFQMKHLDSGVDILASVPFSRQARAVGGSNLRDRTTQGLT